MCFYLTLSVPFWPVNAVINHMNCSVPNNSLKPKIHTTKHRNEPSGFLKTFETKPTIAYTILQEPARKHTNLLQNPLRIRQTIMVREATNPGSKPVFVWQNGSISMRINTDCPSLGIFDARGAFAPLKHKTSTGEPAVKSASRARRSRSLDGHSEAGATFPEFLS